MNLGAGELVVLLLIPLSLAALALTIWALVDATKRPPWAWEAAGQNRTLWIVLLAVALVVGLGIILTVVYLAAVRPKVIAAQDSGPALPR